MDVLLLNHKWISSTLKMAFYAPFIETVYKDNTDILKYTVIFDKAPTQWSINFRSFNFQMSKQRKPPDYKTKRVKREVLFVVFCTFKEHSKATNVQCNYKIKAYRCRLFKFTNIFQ